MAPTTSSSPSPIARTPRPPYYAVIFSNTRDTLNNSEASNDDYRNVAERMVTLAAQADGFLGYESVRDGDGVIGITVSYWKDLESIKVWKNHSEHLIAQEKGKTQWYSAYTTRICRVERDNSL